MRQVAVIGLGNFGASVARELQKNGMYVIAIDEDEKSINDIVPYVAQALILDATDKQSLLDAGLQKFEIAVVAIGSNALASILATLQLKEIGVSKVIAKSQGAYHTKILERVGADLVINPEEEMGLRCAKSIISPNLVDYIELGVGFSVAEVLAGERMIGKTLKDLNIREKAGVNVLAIKHDNKINPIPKGDDRIERNAILIVCGPDEKISELKNI